MRMAILVALVLVTACGSPPEPPPAQEVTGSDVAPDTYQMKTVQVGDIQMRVAEQGDGPLVLLLHGFPESWYSYRHQLPALAQAGFTAVAPDMRGYGSTDAPEAIADYAIDQQCADVVGLIDAYGEDQAVVVGHDWGALVAWQCTLIAEDRIRAVVSLSNAYPVRGPVPPTKRMRERYGDDFYYILYFQEPGVAEAEFDADPRGVLQRLYSSRGVPRDPPEVTDPKASAGGWTSRMGKPTTLPSWLSEEDLDYYVAQFDGRSFRGPVNYYRNFDRNWELLADVDPVVEQPALLVAGEWDGVLGGRNYDQLVEAMAPFVPNLRGIHLLPETGHWSQQEQPEEVNRLLVEFLKALP